ncbi:phosphatidylserine decarboxylase-domain-containing protein [Lentinula aciculospora]|uniref:phosphatidylserine decarboxylase n=1 Tax=Lentinula aciculospora TaxID=153920 RepID=A0A9W9A020_9AGAR|nr:phosphatidylserine decarboxylase-domain-containing protein [Lentinula aciculospora]
MHLLHHQVQDKPVEKFQPEVNNLSEAQDEHIAKGLESMVAHSETNHDVSHGIHMHGKNVFEVPWIHKMIPGIEKLAANYHIGNFVVVRESGERIFESMPIYARIGMHLLFYGSAREAILHYGSVEHLLQAQSVKQGIIYNSADSVNSIPSFVKIYSLDLSELLEPDLTKYNSFNEFFSRKLKPDARPVENLENPRGICSAADSRLTVYPTVNLACNFWIKGDEFTIPILLQVPVDSPTAIEFDGSSLAIFRLAPADYHRFHSPIDGVVGDFTNVPGQYYTVNPQAVNEPKFDVFTANVRSILYLTHAATGKRVAFVAIGALLVGSIVWTKGAEKGTEVKRGEELGYFAYGGSTVIALFPKGVVEFDQDLVKNSEEPIETLVKVGSSLGTTPSA